jgi:hypothetical protein
LLTPHSGSFNHLLLQIFFTFSVRRESLMKLLRFALFLFMFAGIAAVAHADTTDGTSSTPGDFKVILNDPSCPSGTTCVDLGYDGSTPLLGLLFLPPNPIQIPAGQTAACGTNFGTCFTLPGDGDGDSDDYFLGVLFIGTINPGQDLTIGLSGSVSDFSLLLPQGFSCATCTNGLITFTPEPSAALLLLFGLAFLVIMRQKRAAASLVRRA